MTYASLKAGTYFGLELYSALVLIAVAFGILASKYRMRFGTAFLALFNIARIFALGAIAAYGLSRLGTFRMPIDGADSFMFWLLPFGLSVLLQWVYLLGFRDWVRMRYGIFARNSD